MTNPKHTNPTQPDRLAHEPYNFVPLPEKVVTVEVGDLPGYDIYTGYTGYLDCELTTLSPLYTRAAPNPQFFEEWADKTREMMKDDKAREEYAQFFHLGDTERPVIPGSSLRGMVRSLVEIVGYGKVQWITNKQLFFRTMDNTAVGDYYRGRMSDKVESGFLRKRGEQYFIQKCRVARIHRDKLGHVSQLYTGKRPNQIPSWKEQPYQYMPIWVELSASEKFVDRCAYQADENLREGRLVITGDIPKKKKEFVFLMPEAEAEEITVSEELYRRFCDDDQITTWQEQAFSKDRPYKDNRQRDGLPRKGHYLNEEGDPVFFLREGGTLTFFGRAHMFRLPYERSPIECVPSKLKQHNDESGNEIFDIAEAIFGYVPEGKRTTSRAGRVYFSDAVCEPNQETVWLTENIVTPMVLGSPKPTTFQHYLVQDKKYKHDPDNKRSLAHYGTPTPEETVIRGHKCYWHQRASDFIKSTEPDWQTDTQHTQIRPVKEGVTFQFRVYFENLQDFELGALLWVLNLPKGCCHKLGMGKPLGLGSVKVTPTLHLMDRPSRYTQLFDNDSWFEGTTLDKTTEIMLSQFEQYILKRMDPSERGKATRLAEVARIQELLALLNADGPRNPDDATYMELGDFRARPVLPLPSEIADVTKSQPITRTQSTHQPPAKTQPMIPSFAQDSSPPERTIFGYSVGDIFTGKVFDMKPDGTVLVVIPKVPDDRGFARIATSDLGGKQYGVDQQARCQITSITQEGQLTIFQCKPGPKPEGKQKGRGKS